MTLYSETLEKLRLKEDRKNNSHESKFCFRQFCPYRPLAVLLDAQQGKTQLFLSYINLAEIYYRTIREQGRQKGEGVIAAIRKLPIELISATDEKVLKAAEIKAEYPIAFGDCFAAALAVEKKAPILTDDPEFKKLEKLVKIRWL